MFRVLIYNSLNNNNNNNNQMLVIITDGGDLSFKDKIENVLIIYL